MVKRIMNDRDMTSRSECEVDAQPACPFTSMLQKQSPDEMCSHFSMTQEGRIQSEEVTERDSWSVQRQREREKSQRNAFQSLLSLSPPLSPWESINAL